MQLPGRRLVSNVQMPKRDVIGKKEDAPDALNEVYAAPTFGHRLLEL
jgi:hypothetical protein